MENQFERTELLLGKDAIQKLKNAHVAVFGVGGVGGFVVEALVRSGVGEIDVIDKDTVSLFSPGRSKFRIFSISVPLSIGLLTSSIRQFFPVSRSRFPSAPR